MARSTGGMWCLFALVALQAQTGDDLASLVRQYTELHLPLPPEDAPMVRIGDGPYSLCGYLIKDLGQGRLRLQVGTLVLEDRFYGKVSTEVERPIAFPTYDARVHIPQDVAFATAVIEESRGHDEQAEEIFKGAVDWDHPSYPSVFPDLKRGASPVERLRHLARNHWLNTFVLPQGDRSLASSELKGLIVGFPNLATDHIKTTLAQVEETLANRYTGSNEIEKMIDRLCDAEEADHGVSSGDPTARAKFEAVQALTMRFYEAAPQLVAHFGDQRLTRAFDSFTPRHPGGYVTVGDACMGLVEQFALCNISSWLPQYRGRDLRNWWHSVAKNTAIANCRAKLLEPRAEHQGQSEGALLWAEKNAPELLAETVETILKENRPAAPGSALCSLLKTNVDKKRIIELAKKVIESPRIGHVLSGIYTLQVLEPRLADAALLRCLAVMPKAAPRNEKKGEDDLQDLMFDPEEDWDYTGIARLVAVSESTEVWAALREASKRAEVRLRLHLIKQSSYANHTEQSKKLYLEYLESFFGDAETAGKTKLEEMSNQVSPYLRIQDLATELAAYAVGMVDVPSPDAPRETWDRYREEVRSKLRRIERSYSLGSGNM